MAGSDVGHDAHVGQCQPAHLVDFAQPVHAQFRYKPLMDVTKAHQHQRQGVLAVEVAGAAVGFKVLAEDGPDQFLGAALTDAAGDPDHPQAPARPVQALKQANVPDCLH